MMAGLKSLARAAATL